MSLSDIQDAAAHSTSDLHWGHPRDPSFLNTLASISPWVPRSFHPLGNRLGLPSDKINPLLRLPHFLKKKPLRFQLSWWSSFLMQAGSKTHQLTALYQEPPSCRAPRSLLLLCKGPALDQSTWKCTPRQPAHPHCSFPSLIPILMWCGPP